MKFLHFIALAAAFTLMLSACDSAPKPDATYPQPQEDIRKESRGSLTGEGGLFSIGGSKSKSDAGGVLGVNAFLWRATLDTFAFMPLINTDPFGGTVITDWYEDPATPGERFKVNALIIGTSLRADAIKVKLFRQKLTGGTWRDQSVPETNNRQLEDTILTRARELKLEQGK